MHGAALETTGFLLENLVRRLVVLEHKAAAFDDDDGRPGEMVVELDALAGVVEVLIDREKNPSP